jgi:PEP-CTERM motif
VDDGSIYTCNGCNTSPNRSYVLVTGTVANGGVVGDVDFSTAAFEGNLASAIFSVNPYALPLFGTQLTVYGYASSSSTISIADLASPMFIGTWTLPSNLGYGQDAYFDVTAFLQSVQTPYVDIILMGSGTDVFSSTEYNYGQPPQLTVTTPEPSTAILLFLGISVLCFSLRMRKTEVS